MGCINPDTREEVPVGGTACHDGDLFVCTTAGWVNTGAPCGGPHVGTLTKPPTPTR